MIIIKYIMNVEYEYFNKINHLMKLEYKYFI